MFVQLFINEEGRIKMPITKIMPSQVNTQIRRSFSNQKEEEKFVLKHAKQLGETFRKAMGEDFQYNNIETDEKARTTMTNIISNFLPSIRRHFPADVDFFRVGSEITELFYKNVYINKAIEHTAEKFGEVIGFDSNIEFKKADIDSSGKQMKKLIDSVFKNECEPLIDRIIIKKDTKIEQLKEVIYSDAIDMFRDAKATLSRKNLQFKSIMEITAKIFEHFKSGIVLQDKIKEIATNEIQISDDKILDEFYKLCQDETISTKKIQKWLQQHKLVGEIDTIISCQKLGKQMSQLEQKKDELRKQIDTRYQENKSLARKRGVLDEFCLLFGRDNDKNSAVHNKVYE